MKPLMPAPANRLTPACLRQGKRFLLLALISLPGFAAATCSTEVSDRLDLPIAMRYGQPLATVRFNGKPALMRIRSGADKSVVTHAGARQFGFDVRNLPLGLAPFGLDSLKTAGLGRVDRMEFAGREFADAEFYVGGIEPADGSVGWLGRNFLGAGDAEYDLARGLIRLTMRPTACDKRSSPAYWVGEGAGAPVLAELPLDGDDRRSKVAWTRIKVKLNGQELVALLDSNNLSLIRPSAARRIGLQLEKIGGLSESAKARQARVRQIELGALVHRDITLLVDGEDGEDYDLILGTDFLLAHRAFVSKSQHRLYLTYNGGPVFRLDAAQKQRDATAWPAAPQTPADADAYERRASASATRLSYPSALADIDQAIRLKPEVARYHVVRASLHIGLHNRAEAQPKILQDLAAALRLDPMEADALFMRAGLRRGAKEQQGLIEDLERLDRALPAQDARRKTMGDWYDALQMPAAAVTQWSQWLQDRPAHAERGKVLNNRCWARVLLNAELNQALADCDEALALTPRNAEVLDSRAWLRLRRGELAPARADFDQALAAKPDQAWSFYGRSLVHTQLGELEAGKADLAAARRLLPAIDAEVGKLGLPLAR